MRRAQVSTYLSFQKLALVSPTCRVNASCMAIFQLHCMQDLDLFLTEWGALAGGKDNLFAIYKKAVEDAPHSFLWCDFKAPPGKRFMLRFERYLNVDDQ